MSLKHNVLANYLGQGWRVIMSIAFVPLYIKYLGIESYGLIGIFAVLQALLGLLDMGMKPALAREMARFTGGEHDAQSIWDLLRSIEIIAIGVSGILGVGIWFGSVWLASEWVEAENLPVSVVAQAFTLMGFVIALRFIENVYTSSIAGLQRQVLQNIVISIMATLGGLGAVGVLAWVSPTIKAFFIWQGLISLITVVMFMATIYRILPRPQRAARFSILALLDIWHFAAGMLGITFLALLLTQIDKILLSRLLTLEAFGYYALAGLVTGGLYVLVTPIGTAFFPRFTELYARQDSFALKKTYHLGAQLVTVLMGSAALILMVFSERILLLWTADPILTGKVAPIVQVLALGTFLNGLMWIPYQMQLAHGWTSLAVKINSVAVLFLIPVLFLVVPVYGAMGAAWVWVMLNFGYCLIGVHFMFRRILKEEKWSWYFNDIIVPFSVAGLTTLLCSQFLPEDSNRLGELIAIGGGSLVVLLASSFSAPLIRTRLNEYLHPVMKLGR